MPFTQVKKVIERFIRNNENEFLIIKGSWGIGKTYYWQDLIKKECENNPDLLKNYSYVSLFGINTNESLRNSILASKLLGDKKTSKFYIFFNDVQGKLQSLLKNIPYLKLLPLDLVSDIAFLTVSETLICFDDIERKGKGLETEYLLGLACQLKEQKNCKIVFILNDNALSEDDLLTFSKHKEKIVDIELRFAPSIKDIFDYVFEISHPYYDLIKNNSLLLEIENVRILKRIHKIIEDISSYFVNIEMEVIEEIIHSLILFIWCHYDKEHNPPSLDFLESYSWTNLYIRKEIRKEEIPLEDEKISKLLSKYNYRNTSELGKELIFLVKKGFLNEDSFIEALEKKNKEAIAKKGNESSARAMKLYNSFEDNEEEFVGELISGFRDNVEYIEFSSLEETVFTLRDLEKNTEANSLVDLYFNTHQEMFTPKIEKPLLINSSDTYIQEKINEIRENFNHNFNFAKIIETNALKDYLSSYEQAKFLASHEPLDYLNFFKSLKPDQRNLCINFCLRIGEYDDGNGYYKKIHSDAMDALKTISSESKINRVRIKDWFKIDFEEAKSESDTK